MHQVLLYRSAPVAPEVTPNGSRCRERGICCSRERAEALNDPIAGYAKRHDWPSLHEVNERLEIRSSFVLRVVCHKRFAIGLNHSEIYERIPFRFDSAKNFTGQVPGNAVGLDENQSFFGVHVSILAQIVTGCSVSLDRKPSVCCSVGALGIDALAHHHAVNPQAEKKPSGHEETGQNETCAEHPDLHNPTE